MVRREWDSSIVVDPSGSDRKLILVEVVPTADLVGVLAANVRIKIVGLTVTEARETLLEGVAAAISGRRPPQPTVPSWLTDRVLSARLPVPVAPRRVVERPGVGAALRERIHGGAIMGLVGPGGAGKTTTAQTIAADVRVRERFEDRIVWLNVGRHPDLAACRDRLAEALGGGIAGTTECGLDELRRLAAHGRHLVVLDDVWDTQHLAELDVAVGETACVVTTRDRAVLPWQADVLDIGLVDDATARRILASWAASAPEDLPAAAGPIAQRCGGLPLALAAAGGLVRSGLDWPDVAAKLDAVDDEELALRMPGYPYPTLLRALSVGVDSLPFGLRERLEAMVVLRDRGTVPIEVCGVLWVDGESVVRSSLTQLSERSLVTYDPAAGTVGVHELLLRSLASGAGEEFLDASHLSFARTLLAGLRRPERSAAGTNALDRYAARHVVGHLVEANRPELVHDLLAESVEVTDDGAARPANFWFHIHTRTGGVGGYLTDLDTARKLVERETDEGAAQKMPTLGCAYELRYALLRASVTALTSTMPSSVPAQLVRRGMWSTERAVAHAAAMSSDGPDAQVELLELVEEKERADMAAAVLDSPHVNELVLVGPIGRTIRPCVSDQQWKRKVAGLVRDARGGTSAWDLLVVAELHDGSERQALLREAVAKARYRSVKGIPPERLTEANALIALAQYASDGDAIGEALRATWALQPGTRRAACLLKMAELVSGLRRRRLVHRARIDALADRPTSSYLASDRLRVLAELLDRSTGQARKKVLSALVHDACRDPTQASDALKTVAAKADANQFARVTAAVRDVADPVARAKAAVDLVDGAEGVRREELILEALRGAEKIVATTAEDRDRTMYLLARLAAHLPDERGDVLLRRVVALSGQIGDAADLAPWRAALAAHLPDEVAAPLRASALADVRTTRGRRHSVACLLPEPARSQELRNLLHDALGEQDAFKRGFALRDLAPDLPTPLAREAAAALRQLFRLKADRTSYFAIRVAREAGALLLDRFPERERVDLLPGLLELIEQRDMWAESIDRLGPQMSIEEIRALLDLARSRYNEVGMQIRVATLLPWMPPGMRRQLVPGVRAAADTAPVSMRAAMMVGLAKTTIGPEGAEFRQAALASAREMPAQSAIRIFIAVAPLIEATEQAAVLAEARSLASDLGISTGLGQAVQVAIVADQILDEAKAWSEYWRPLIRAAAADSGRSSVGLRVETTTNAVHRLGGSKAVHTVATAIDDAMRWWP